MTEDRRNRPSDLRSSSSVRKTSVSEDAQNGRSSLSSVLCRPSSVLRTGLRPVPVLGRPGGPGKGHKPDPIPNSAVKPLSAHGTKPQGLGESVAARPAKHRTHPSHERTLLLTSTQEAIADGRQDRSAAQNVCPSISRGGAV